MATKLQIKLNTAAEIIHIKNEIKCYFNSNGPDCKAIIGMSGGKDSTVAAALLKEALGPDRVFGVLMPNGEDKDLSLAIEICEYLGIQYRIIDIKPICDAFYTQIKHGNDQVIINTPPRIRMSMLYAIAALEHGRVINTCNFSEDYVGYSTKYGDLAGDFSPLGQYTVREIRQLGAELGLPDKYIYKVPADGLTGLTDEDNLGFSYEVLDELILEDRLPEYEIYNKIMKLHTLNLHKSQTIRIPTIKPKTREWSE